jgi:tetratricopeptide (TPR) repeat protein
VHALMRGTLYSTLTTTRRVRLHRRIGEALESLYGANVEPHLAELAYHFFEAGLAGDVDKAVDYATRAGERANRLLAYEEAATHCERALQALDLKEPREDGRRCAVLLALGQSLWSAGEIEQSKDTCLQAADLARRLRIPEQLARAALGVGGRPGGARVGIVDETLVKLLDEALDAVGPAESPLRAKLMASLADALFYDARDRSVSLARAAVAMARRSGDRATLAWVLRHTHESLSTPDNVGERLAIYRELARLAEETGEIDMALGAQYWTFDASVEIGDISEADRALHGYAKLGEELRLPYYLAGTHVMRTARALMNGRFTEAEQLAQQSLLLAQTVANPAAAPAFGPQMFLLRREQGRLGELEAVTKAAVEQYPALSAAWRAALAVLYCEMGRDADARCEFEHLATNDFADLPQDLTWTTTVTLLADVCASLGDTRRAAVLYERLKPNAQHCVVMRGAITLGSASRPLGLLATTMGRWQEAAQHFEDALEMNTRIGSPPWVAHTQHDYARMLLARGEPGDRDKALELLADVLDTAQELGMKALLDRVSELKSRVAT